MSRKLSFFSPLLLAVCLACSSPSTQETVAMAPVPFVDLNSPIDHVFKVIASDRPIAIRVAQEADAVEKGENGEIWLLKQGGIRIHLLPTSATTTRVEMGTYIHPAKNGAFGFEVNRDPNESKAMADLTTKAYLAPLKSWFDGGEQGPAPSIAAMKTH